MDEIKFIYIVFLCIIESRQIWKEKIRFLYKRKKILLKALKNKIYKTGEKTLQKLVTIQMK